MSDVEVEIVVDGRPLRAREGTSLLTAIRAAGNDLPGICSCDRDGYAPRASCRLCLVEIEGESALVPACRRPVSPRMEVHTSSDRVRRTRAVIAELTLSELPEGALRAGTALSAALKIAGVTETRFGRATPQVQKAKLHPAIAVDLDACVRCGLCQEACQDVQVNGVIGMAGRGAGSRIIFDMDVPLADSDCVACGECVQVCPTGALSVTDPAPKEQARAETICPFCSVGCRVELIIADGRVVGAAGADGPANHGRLCVKGRFGFDYLHHPDRLTTPLIRREGIPKTADRISGTEAVGTLFRPATWDEALARAAAGLKAVREQHGAESLAVLGSAKASNEDAYVLQKFARAVLGTPHVDHCTRLCASVPPLAEAIGWSAVTAPIDEVKRAEVILMVGSNPEVNHPVAATIIKNAIGCGTKLILVDPYTQPFARQAEHHLALRPGTDVALILAMINVVITEELFDEDFVRDRVSGFDALAARVSAATPDVAARITGVEAGTIIAAARLFAKADRAMCFWGMGASQHVHGADNIRCVIALALICGHVGKPGCGLHPLRGQNNVQGSCDAGLTPTAFPGYRSLADPATRERLSVDWNAELPATPGRTVVEILDAAQAGQIRGLYVAGGNPAMANPDLARTREGLAQLDWLVVQDIFPTETAAFADVILPVAALAERSGSVTSTDRIVQLIEPAVAPPGLARPDWWITVELARRMGWNWSLRDVGMLFDEMAALVPMLEGTSWALLREHRALATPLRQGSESASLFADRFPTADGRARLVVPSGQGPAEIPDEDYPLVLVTGRVLEHWHTGSMTRRSRVLDAIAPAAVVRVAPREFEQLGLGHDARIVVETRRGQVTAAAHCDAGLQPGVIWMPFAYFEAAANELTNSALDPTTRVPEYKYCSARIFVAAEATMPNDHP